MSTPLQSAVVVLADSDTGKGSPIGLFILLLLVVAVYFLYRSMTRHLRKVPTTFDANVSADNLPTDQPAGAQPPARRQRVSRRGPGRGRP